LRRISNFRKIANLLKFYPIEVVSKRLGVSVETLLRVPSIAIQIEQTLIRTNLRLVLSIAISYQGKGLELDDLVYEGVKGLKKAIDKFDADKGCAFSTYAYPWIREFIRAALASSLPIKLPQHVYKLLVKVRAIQTKFLTVLGRSPTDEELATELGVSMERFEIVRKAMALVDRYTDRTPAVIENAPSRYDESTW